MVVLNKVSLADAVEQSDVLIVGSGLFGLTVAERIASETTKKVVIVEKRGEIGGNAYSYFDEDSGIEIHKYGSHLFHTSNKRVWDYVNRFTEFSDYKHRVYTKHKGVIYSMPINLQTLSHFFERDLSPSEARELISKPIPESAKNFSSFEEKAISMLGLEIYEAFFKNYTLKQWQTPPSELPSEIFSRLPIRFNLNNDYFDDTYQGLPKDGYLAWFSKMIESKNIEVFLNTDFFDIKDRFDLSSKLVIYTGPIDRYFEFRHGELSWRTLDFELESLDVDDYQGTSVMNYADMPPSYTRIHEFKHLHPERKYPDGKTIIAREFSRKAEKSDEPYYPINSEPDRQKLVRYREEIAKEKQVLFGGRLGSYQYLDMHMAIASALTMFDNEIVPFFDRVTS
jgi:UDP-galactopyranose mutase